MTQQNQAMQQQQQNRAMVFQQSQQNQMIVPQQGMVAQQNLVQMQQYFVQPGMMMQQQNMVYNSQPLQGVIMQQHQKSQFIMTQAVPQQMQQVSVNQQLQQQGYQSEPVTCWKQFCFLKNSVEANPQVSNCVIVKCLLFLVQLRRITEAIENNTTNIQGEFPLGC